MKNLLKNLIKTKTFLKLENLNPKEQKTWEMIKSQNDYQMRESIVPKYQEIRHFLLHLDIRALGQQDLKVINNFLFQSKLRNFDFYQTLVITGKVIKRMFELNILFQSTNWKLEYETQYQILVNMERVRFKWT